MNIAFNADIIGELRKRAIAHNELVTDASLKIRIGQMKGLYKRFHGGTHPHAHALSKIDEHLADLRLNKARPPFDGGRHPRDRSGEFRSGGTPPAARGDDPLLDAAQTQVIPETRFSTFGPPIAGAAGIILGAGAGATSSLRGAPTDRLVTRGLRHVGGKMGEFTGLAASKVGVETPRSAARAAVGAVNRRFGTRIPRPSASAGAAATNALRAGGWTAGQIGGAALGHGLALSTALPAAMARGATSRVAGGGFRGALLGSIAGGLTGAVFPGALLYAPALARLQASIGPYEDAAFPRRVRKMAGELFDSAEVLAKQNELLGDETLAKLSVAGAGRLIARGLARLRRPGTPGAAAGPPTAEEAAAQGAFARHASHFTVRPLRAGRALHVGSHALAIAGAGAGGGALLGAGLASFDQKHPRDPKGRFARHAAAAKKGAYIGTAIGAGIGLATGLAAARTGRTALLTQAIARLRGTTTTDGVNLHDAMVAEARRTAQVSHAHAFRTEHAKEIPDFAGSGGEPEHVANTLRGHAVQRWMDTVGQAIQSGAKGWYRFQLDQAFDRRARSMLSKLGSIKGFDDKAVRGGNLINNVDPSKLNEAQGKIWTNLVERRAATLRQIDDIYTARAEHTNEISSHITRLRGERGSLEAELQGKAGRISVSDRWGDMRDEPETSIGQMRTFAKERLGHDLTATTKPKAREEIDARLTTWEAERHARLTQVEEELGSDENTRALEAARNAQQADLTPDEAHAIINPFAEGKNALFRERPPGSNTTAGFAKLREKVADDAARAFLDNSERAALAAEDHLSHLVNAREALLQSGLSGPGVAERTFSRVAPVLSGHMRQAIEDYSALVNARRAGLTGTQKRIANWLDQNKDPATAWATIVGMAGKAGRTGRRAGGFTMRNWKTIASVIGPLTAFGAVDLQQPFGRNVQLNPKKWRHPANLGIVTEWPDPIRRPNEALIGVSYRTKEGQNRFLTGLHIHGANGEHHTLPFGSDVDQVRAILRGGQQAGGNRNVEPVKVENAKALEQTLDQLNRAGHIKDVGPEGFDFKQREGGTADTAQRDYANSFYNRFLKGAEQYVGTSHNRQNIYYDSIAALFHDKGASVLDLAARAQLLVGNHRLVQKTGGNGRRGIFASSFGRDNDPFKAPGSADKAAVTRELVRQTAIHPPGNEENFALLRQATWTAAEYYDLDSTQKRQVEAALAQHFTRSTSKPPPTKAPEENEDPVVNAALNQVRGANESRGYADRLLTRVPEHLRPSAASTDEKFRALVQRSYERHRQIALQEKPEATEAELRQRAERDTQTWLEGQIGSFTKIDPFGELRKLLSDRPSRTKIRPPSATPSRVPVITGAATNPNASAKLTPPISQAAVPQGAGVPQPGAPRGPSIGQQVRTAVRPAHALSQLGSYGLGQGAFEAATAAAEHFLPGGGIVGQGLRFGGALASAVVGSNLGQKAGRSAGRALGDKTPNREHPPGEQIARGVGGTAGQIAGSALAARAIGGGAAALAGAGEGAEVGALGGVPGILIGGGIGALTGYLSDEGASILYHHLSRYGAHVPHQIMGPQMAGQAAKRLSGGRAA